VGGGGGGGGGGDIRFQLVIVHTASNDLIMLRVSVSKLMCQRWYCYVCIV